MKNLNILYLIRKIKYKHFGKYTGKYSGILSINNDNIIFYRGNKEIEVKKNGNRIVYADYNDWKLVQSCKGKKKDLSKLWEVTKDKQIRNWDFAEISENEKVLEVGFRDGCNLRYLQQKDIQVEGIEINVDAVEHAKNLGCKAFEEDIQMETHYKDKTFNVVSACDVLEHCFSPERALKEMYRILKDDGRIVIEIPFENKFKKNLIHGHSALFYNEHEFEIFVNSSNFYIHKRDLADSQRNLFILKKKMKIKRKIYRIIIKLILKLHTFFYRLSGHFCIKTEGGLHPKHRLMNYHKFFIDNINSEDTVLDIGCGNGALTFDIAKKATKVIGIDLNGKNIEFAKERFSAPNVEYIIGDATENLPDKRFDAIILSNVLEHIENRIEFLKKIKKMAPKILIRVPMFNRDWIVLYKKELGVEWRSDKTHYTEYTLKSFRHELNQASLNLSDYSIQFGEIWAVVFF